MKKLRTFAIGIVMAFFAARSRAAEPPDPTSILTWIKITVGIIGIIGCVVIYWHEWTNSK